MIYEEAVKHGFTASCFMSSFLFTISSLNFNVNLTALLCTKDTHRNIMVDVVKSR